MIWKLWRALHAQIHNIFKPISKNDCKERVMDDYVVVDPCWHIINDIMHRMQKVFVITKTWVGNSMQELGEKEEIQDQETLHLFAEIFFRNWNDLTIIKTIHTNIKIRQHEVARIRFSHYSNSSYPCVLILKRGLRLGHSADVAPQR